MLKNKTKGFLHSKKKKKKAYSHSQYPFHLIKQHSSTKLRPLRSIVEAKVTKALLQNSASVAMFLLW